MKVLPRIVLLLSLFAIALPLAAQDVPPPPTLIPEIINVYPHDPNAFTQGLLLHDGVFYESTGRYGESTLRIVDPTTGDVGQMISVPEEFHAEGLELVGDRLIQLTWKGNTAFVYDVQTFELLDEINYEGEGWGLCYDGRFLFMSDSTEFLSIRDPETFELLFRGLVSIQGRALNPNLLNELECVGDHIYANAWLTDFIVKIDKMTGEIVALIDASNLLTDEERAALDPSATLNGITYNPDTDTFFLTGKLWDKMFEVRFVPGEG